VNGVNQDKPVFGTFGIYRWIMASMVALNHLGPMEFSQFGPYAVFGFFILSGYIVTYILRTHYLQTKYGIVKYYLNRGLRVFPSYWVVMVLSALLVARFPDIASHIHGDMRMPRNLNDWITNGSLLGITSLIGDLYSPVLVPVAWSLSVELLWWGAMPHILRDQSYFKVFLIFGFMYAFLMLCTQIAGSESNAGLCLFSPMAGLMPFMVGMLLCLRKYKRFADMPMGAGIVAMTLLGLYFLIGTNPKIGLDASIALYANVVLQMAVIYYLSGIDAARLPKWIERVDRQLGNLSYPIFLLHMAMGVMAKALLPSLEYSSWGLFAVGLLLCNVMGVILFYSVETPVNMLRRSIRV
jgi:peptidoglycan/LPS O-acetylase OafA/YrhL